MILNQFPTPEGFKGAIVPLQAADLISIRPILETWLKDRNTGEPLPEEVESVLKRMRDSIQGLNDYQYIVAINEENEAIGVMGIRVPEEKMMPYASTSNPAELVNAYVSADNRNGKGIGRALVNGLCELAAFLGYTEIILNSGPRYKDTAWGFYTKVMGEPVAIAEGMYGEGGDAPVWRKVL